MTNKSKTCQDLEYWLSFYEGRMVFFEKTFEIMPMFGRILLAGALQEIRRARQLAIDGGIKEFLEGIIGGPEPNRIHYGYVTKKAAKAHLERLNRFLEWNPSPLRKAAPVHRALSSPGS